MRCNRATTCIAVLCLVRPALAQKPQAVLQGHEHVVSAVTFTPDGRQLISASWDKTVRVWDTGSGQLTGTLKGHQDWVLDVWISADGKTISSASQRAIRLWSRETLSETALWTGLGGANVNSLAFSPHGNLLATGGRDGFARVWKVGDKQPATKLKGFESWVSQVAITPDQKQLVTGTRTGKIRVFELPSGKLIREQVAHPDRQVQELSISPAGDLLLSSGYQQNAVLWNLATGEEVAKLSGHRGVVTASAWSRDGEILATGERHGSVHLWNATNQSLLRKISAHPDKQLGFSVTALAFSRDGEWLASGSYDKSIKLWRVATD